MINLTEKACQEVAQVIEQQRQELPEEHRNSQLYLRVGVKGGGCSGFSYSLDLDDQVRDNDERMPQNGIEVICDSKSYLYLDGTTIDFKDGLMGRGFVFSNPNATTSCGCGSSFSA